MAEDEKDINDWLKAGLEEAAPAPAAEEGKAEEKKEDLAEEKTPEPKAEEADPPEAKPEKRSKEDELIHELRMEGSETRKEMKAVLDHLKVTLETQSKLMETLSAQSAKKDETPEEKEQRIAKDREEFEKDPAGFLQRELSKHQAQAPAADPSKLSKEQKEELAKSNGFDSHEQMEVQGHSARNWREMVNATDTDGKPAYPLLKSEGVLAILEDKAFLKEVASFLMEDGRSELDVVKSKSFYRLAYKEAASRFLENQKALGDKGKKQGLLEEAGGIDPTAGGSGKAKAPVAGDAWTAVEKAWADKKAGALA